MLTVTTPSSTYDLTTLATVKAYLKLTAPDEDVLINFYIHAMSCAVSTYCNRVFAEETLSEQIRLRIFDYYPYYSHYGYRRAHPHEPVKLTLTRFPVTSVISVVEDGVLLDPSVPDYEIDLPTGIMTRIRNDRESSWYAEKTVIAYVAGFKLTTDATRSLPPDIEEATIRLVQMTRSNALINPRVKSETITGVREVQYWVGTIPGGGRFPPDITALLQRYIRNSIG
jgi:hypothetical protein